MASDLWPMPGTRPPIRSMEQLEEVLSLADECRAPGETDEAIATQVQERYDLSPISEELVVEALTVMVDEIREEIREAEQRAKRETEPGGLLSDEGGPEVF